MKLDELEHDGEEIIIPKKKKENIDEREYKRVQALIAKGMWCDPNDPRCWEGGEWDEEAWILYINKVIQ